MLKLSCQTMLSCEVKKNAFTMIKAFLCLILAALLLLTISRLVDRSNATMKDHAKGRIVSELMAEHFVETHIFRTHFSEPKTHQPKIVLYTDKLPVFEGTTLEATIEFLNQVVGPWYQVRNEINDLTAKLYNTCLAYSFN